MIGAGVEQGGSVGTTSLSLLARVRTDDQAAWARLVALYGPLVYQWCVRAGLRWADAADVGQEVFLAVARNIHGFHHNRPGDSFRGWLFTIARNKLRDRAKRAGDMAEGGGNGRFELVPAPPEPDAAEVWDDRRLLVHRAVELVRGEFEVRTWEAFWRTTVEGVPVADAAAALGITREAVYIARSRVRRRLLAEFGELIELAPDGPP